MASVKYSNNLETGFTLLELLIAIAVVGIIASIAAPSFSNFLANQQLRSDFNEVTSAISFARSESIKRREVIELNINSTDSFWQISVKDKKSDKNFRSFNGRNAKVNITGFTALEFGYLGSRNLCTPLNSDDLCIMIVEIEGKKRKIEVLPSGGIQRVN